MCYTVTMKNAEPWSWRFLPSAHVGPCTWRTHPIHRLRHWLVYLLGGRGHFVLDEDVRPYFNDEPLPPEVIKGSNES